ncbi:MAG: type II secretion system protein, partial [Planctomyces sp.]
MGKRHGFTLIELLVV